ncbi:MAG: hypothetical protein ABI647_23510, partial [Gemmatimonadota bacterium]
AAVLRTDSAVLPVAVASAGNYLGAVTTYLFAGVLAKRLAARWHKPVGARAAQLMRRFGPPALLLSWVPIVGDGIVAAAGVARGSVRSLLALDAGWQSGAVCGRDLGCNASRLRIRSIAVQPLDNYSADGRSYPL